jgi:hypothetical protein
MNTGTDLMNVSLKFLDQIQWPMKIIFAMNPTKNTSATDASISANRKLLLF